MSRFAEFLIIVIAVSSLGLWIYGVRWLIVDDWDRASLPLAAACLAYAIAFVVTSRVVAKRRRDKRYDSTRWR